MPCYHPLIRVEDRHKWTKAADGHKYHPAKVMPQTEINELEGIDELKPKKEYWDARYVSQMIPCGKCIGCKLDYSREWANRGYLEAKQWEQNWFCTITYDEDHIQIPEEVQDDDGITYVNDGSWTGTLVPKDLTQFIKNVRQIMKREHNQDNIRFMACGEYGSEGKRPHYHIIFFNLNLPVEDLYAPRIINKEFYYQSHIIERAWGKGICNISEATWNNIAYTARYITKKINGKYSEQEYKACGQEKEFLRVSRMPGIGEGYYRKHWKEIYEKDEIIIKNKAGTVSSKPPKYFDELFKKEHPKEYEKLHKRREKYARVNGLVKDGKTSLFRVEQLAIEEREHEEKHLRLQRAMETGSQ